MDELGAALLEHLAEETGDHGSLLQAAMSDGELDPDEVVSNAAVIMFGGIETTEGPLLNAVWYLLREPDLYAAIVDEPGLVPAAVEESLRIEPAAAVVDRYATRRRAGRLCDLRRIAGDRVARRRQPHPAVFADPDRFEIHRPQRRQHLAFAARTCASGWTRPAGSRHRCGGARRPALWLAADAPPPTGLVFRKPVSLPVVLR